MYYELGSLAHVNERHDQENYGLLNQLGRRARDWGSGRLYRIRVGYLAGLADKPPVMDWKGAELQVYEAEAEARESSPESCLVGGREQAQGHHPLLLLQHDGTGRYLAAVQADIPEAPHQRQLMLDQHSVVDLPRTPRYLNNSGPTALYADTDAYNYDTPTLFAIADYPVGRIADESGSYNMPSALAWAGAAAGPAVLRVRDGAESRLALSVWCKVYGWILAIEEKRDDVKIDSGCGGLDYGYARDCGV
ncbi:hypothetical protein B0H11DRAFT_1915821 [Mycena galericulata]|nr:hypothetical protein B0H11DRAFT_1915821 [Mycena galericulata]